MAAEAQDNCIFCRIVSGEIPCHKLFEDGQVLAFLDVGPLSDGHCLIIPKAHYATLEQMPDDVGAACGRVLPRLARAVLAATETRDFNVLQNNGQAAHQAVDHVHFHIIPKTSDGGLGVHWPAGKLEAEQGRVLAQAIVERMKG